MGLDNGICIKRTPESEQIKEVLEFEKDWQKQYKFDFEVVYFRKCWNVRLDIFGIIGPPEAPNDTRTPVKLEHIDPLISLFKSYNRKTWDAANSIWDYEDIKPHIKTEIKNLKKLKKIMQNHDVEVYFYDSY